MFTTLRKIKNALRPKSEEKRRKAANVKKRLSYWAYIHFFETGEG